MTRKIVTIFWTICIYVSSSAQAPEPGAWLYYLGNHSLNQKWNIHSEIQHRNYSFDADLEQVLLRTGIGYQMDPNQNLLLGYGFIHTEAYDSNGEGKSIFPEHRIYQQWTLSEKYGRVVIQHRYRFEERFLKDLFKFRYRYFLLGQVPLNKSKLESKAFYLAAYNEIFINHEQNNYFDRNRSAILLGYCLSKTLRMEMGIMTQFLPASQRTQVIIGIIKK